MDITQEEYTRLKEAADKTTVLETEFETLKRNNARMQEALIINEGRSVIAATLAAINMPAVTRERLAVESVRVISATDGVLNRDALVEAVKKLATDEIAYLTSVTGITTGGRVVGVGESASTEESAEAVDATINEAFAGFGLSEAEVKIASEGRKR